MAPFRRCGLEDNDEIGARPATLRYRHHHSTACCSETISDDDESTWEEESIISAMTTTSDLQSVYNESSSHFHPLDRRERFLLQHRLPQPSRSVSMVLSEEERSRVLSHLVPSTSTTDVEDENESWNDDDAMLHNPWLSLQKRPPERQCWQMVYPGKIFLDPHEKGITGGFRNDFDMWSSDREYIQLSQILERDESSTS